MDVGEDIGGVYYWIVLWTLDLKKKRINVELNPNIRIFHSSGKTCNYNKSHVDNDQKVKRSELIMDKLNFFDESFFPNKTKFPWSIHFFESLNDISHLKMGQNP